jgi:Domain of unknown function (DUF397)
MTPLYAQWRKSSHSAQETDCVELACVGVGVVRDSKNPTGPALNVDLAGLLNTIKADRLSR